MKKVLIPMFVVLLGIGIVQTDLQYSAADRDPGPLVMANTDLL